MKKLDKMKVLTLLQPVSMIVAFFMLLFDYPPFIAGIFMGLSLLSAVIIALSGVGNETKDI